MQSIISFLSQKRSVFTFRSPAYSSRDSRKSPLLTCQLLSRIHLCDCLPWLSRPFSWKHLSCSEVKDGQQWEKSGGLRQWDRGKSSQLCIKIILKHFRRNCNALQLVINCHQDSSLWSFNYSECSVSSGTFLSCASDNICRA